MDVLERDFGKCAEGLVLMKMYLFKILVFVLVVTQLSCSDKDQYPLESLLFDRVESALNEDSIDIIAINSRVEDDLLSKKIIKSLSNDDIKGLLDTIIQRDFSLGINDTICTNYRNYSKYLSELSNSDKADLSLMNKGFSPFFRTYVKVMDGIEQQGYLNPSVAASIYKVEAPNDSYVHPLFKTTIFAAISQLYCSNQIDKGLQVSLPPLKPKISTKDNIEILQIKVNGEDVVIVNNKNVTYSEVSELCKHHILKMKTRAIISLKNERGTGYEAYVQTYNAITAAYNNVWDEYSIKTYGKKYRELNDIDKKAVKAIYPKKLSEAEPISTN